MAKSSGSGSSSDSSRAAQDAAADKIASVASGADKQEQHRAETAADRIEQRYGMIPREDRAYRK